MRTFVGLITPAVLSGLAPQLAAQCELQKLEGSRDDQYDNYGIDVAVDGDVMIVGTTGGGTGAGWDQGRAYIYRNVGGTWTEEAVLELELTITP